MRGKGIRQCQPSLRSSSPSLVRGHFWLATLVVLTIQYVGDAAGHIYFWLVDNNTQPYNIGIPLWTDLLLPIVMWVLYVLSRRNHGDAVPRASVEPTAVLLQTNGRERTVIG